MPVAFFTNLLRYNNLLYHLNSLNSLLLGVADTKKEGEKEGVRHHFMQKLNLS